MEYVGKETLEAARTLFSIPRAEHRAFAAARAFLLYAARPRPARVARHTWVVSPTVCRRATRARTAQRRGPSGERRVSAGNARCAVAAARLLFPYPGLAGWGGGSRSRGAGLESLRIALDARLPTAPRTTRDVPARSRADGASCAPRDTLRVSLCTSCISSDAVAADGRSENPRR
ncbi:hypothetical protein AcV5_001829 [Taiwanofungus camphoratus]|nr:hypothetical protein AcV5_001829 [Antrodia cinnamomea]